MLVKQNDFSFKNYSQLFDLVFFLVFAKKCLALVIVRTGAGRNPESKS